MTKSLGVTLVVVITLTVCFCAHATENPQGESELASVFKVVPTPNGHPKPFQNDLHSVSASSTNDIWAVGQTAIHFDGTKWTAFPVAGSRQLLPSQTTVRPNVVST